MKHHRNGFISLSNDKGVHALISHETLHNLPGVDLDDKMDVLMAGAERVCKTDTVSLLERERNSVIDKIKQRIMEQCNG